MPVNRVRELVKILDQSKLESLSVEWEGFSFKGKKPQQGQVVLPAAGGGPSSLVPVADQAGPVTVKEPEGQVASPLVGTVYLAPSPDAEPYVQVGDWVEKGQTLCIIEAMKVMNEVPAPHGGRVTQVLCENGHVVGYGDGLFVVEEGHV